MSDELFAELFGESGSESEAHTTKSNAVMKPGMLGFVFHPSRSNFHVT